MIRTDEIKTILHENQRYQEVLFIRGYLITTKAIDNLGSYPFYGGWVHSECGSLDGRVVNVYYHKKQNFYMYKNNNVVIAMIGHAYNPFDMIYNEIEILKSCVEEYRKSDEAFFEKVSELTGIHLILVNDGERLIGVQDCSGMKSCYFGKVKSDIYLTSHPQLVGDICNLQMDPFVERLVRSRPYNIGNRHLPGNITTFRELKRLGGNTFVELRLDFQVKRFYPLRPHDEIRTKGEFRRGVESIVDIIHRNIDLAAQKWRAPAISLSGGIDSKTTLACANGLYSNFKYFSFHCKPQELVDANAAHCICDKLGLEHSIYAIPEKNSDIEDFDIFSKIIAHNTSYFMNLSDHEIRKIITLYHLDEFDVELKSWASETARVFLERKYKVKMPSKLTERHFSIFQTRYFLVPDLLKKSDELYYLFMKEVGLDGPIFNFEHSDLFYWEVRMGAWGTSVVSSLDICHEVTMPINNRKLLEIFLSFPHDDRKADKVHKEVIKFANRRIDEMDVDVKNLYFHAYRIWLEKVFYYSKTLFYRSKID